MIGNAVVSPIFNRAGFEYAFAWADGWLECRLNCPCTAVVADLKKLSFGSQLVIAIESARKCKLDGSQLNRKYRFVYVCVCVSVLKVFHHLIVVLLLFLLLLFFSLKFS